MIDPDNDTKCKARSKCSEYEENSCKGYIENLKKFCLYESDACKEYANCEAFGIEGDDCKVKSDGRCDIKNGKCGEVSDGNETSVDIVECSERSETKCSEFYSGKANCVWFTTDKKCVKLDDDHKCSDRADETLCGYENSCKWDADACKDKECADYTEHCYNGA